MERLPSPLYNIPGNFIDPDPLDGDRVGRWPNVVIFLKVPPSSEYHPSLFPGDWVPYGPPNIGYIHEWVDAMIREIEVPVPLEHVPAFPPGDFIHHDVPDEIHIDVIDDPPVDVDMIPTDNDDDDDVVSCIRDDDIRYTI
ncbi:hypothetical protein R1flu_008902 [Riccia fluitans]|uniref:Uncharacterized protein n=1 Tax=Riccia fluitans TaxID=41844 RepID=A0ABD1Z1F3_9MARC